jgi:hypothetical protein
MTRRITHGLLIALVLTTAHLAVAQVSDGPCAISGNIVAMPTPDPGPAWVYTLTFTWDTGSPYALSHANLFMDEADGNCTCTDFQEVLVWDDPVGYSDGDPLCTVQYSGLLQCDGDPSIPDLGGILLKFEPILDGTCEPGPAGAATFTFYSHLAPAPIDADILSLVDKSALNSCSGTLSGDFPAMECDPVAAEPIRWGKAKSLYR